MAALIRLFVVALVLGTSVVLSVARRQLVGVESTSMAAWPSHVIFGLYFAVLALSVQAVQQPGKSGRQMLLLLILIGVCLDLVLVNVTEVVTKVDASYGLVVLWDIATFFIWMRAVDLCNPGRQEEFDASWLIPIVPLLKLGREVLFLPYSPPAELAYFDLICGDVAISLWAFMIWSGVRVRWPSRPFLAVALSGCAYWLSAAIPNILFLAWPPLGPLLYRMLDTMKLQPVIINLSFLAIGLMTVFAVWVLNLGHFGSKLGLRS